MYIFYKTKGLTYFEEVHRRCREDMEEGKV